MNESMKGAWEWHRNLSDETGTDLQRQLVGRIFELTPCTPPCVTIGIHDEEDTEESFQVSYIDKSDWLLALVVYPAGRIEWFTMDYETDAFRWGEFDGCLMLR